MDFKKKVSCMRFVRNKPPFFYCLFNKIKDNLSWGSVA